MLTITIARCSRPQLGEELSDRRIWEPIGQSASAMELAFG
jgi:hypothetical protein